MPTNDQLRAMIERLETPNAWYEEREVFGERPQCFLNAAPFDAADMLRELLADRQWRDMDSAPRDGSVILLWSGDVSFDGYWSEFDDGWLDAAADDIDDYITHFPTKWRHLPTPETIE